MACKITDRDTKITTKRVDGQPVRLVIQKATRKCSEDIRALGEQEGAEIEGATPEEIEAFNRTWLPSHLVAHTKAVGRNFSSTRSDRPPDLRSGTFVADEQ